MVVTVVRVVVLGVLELVELAQQVKVLLVDQQFYMMLLQVVVVSVRLALMQVAILVGMVAQEHQV
jgi:hypothetical protein